jgi:hypothetical protein
VNKIRWIIEQAIAKLQDLADHAYRLPSSNRNIRGNHHSSDQPGVLQNCVNNPQGTERLDRIYELIPVVLLILVTELI